ncbi:MAG: UbiX family flavin prenyltransferase [Marinicaulis sp.]|nr:UbiX family flavin prenyltransferase [Marinicaulis sp.]NNL88269.1 UbiX family flavin prenyltransferase [Marinicaulis sp.]
MESPKRIIVGVTGASGSIFGVRALEALRECGVETHLIVSRAAEMTLRYELDMSSADLEAKADVRHAVGDIGAAISSGSFETLGMLIAPCSVKTMSEIATGVTTSLMSRAADVALKEQRILVLMVRETPFHLGHLRTMTSLAEMGAVIAPPLPAFYAEPQSVDDLVDQSVGRALDQFGLSSSRTRRWGEDIERGNRKS